MSELTAQFDLPLGVEAPKAARGAVRSILRSWGFHDLDWLAQVSVVVSELVANALRHGGGCLQLDVQAHGQQVTIGAADGSAAVPRRREPDPEGGYGIALIEAFAIRWGVEHYQAAKESGCNALRHHRRPRTAAEAETTRQVSRAGQSHQLVLSQVRQIDA
jgi:anti-sigma regulatory factor (Ser/Thr protein kinase)